MKQLFELSQNDLKEVVGGESFAYRAGQTTAILWDLTFGGRQGIIDTTGGILAIVDWFG